MISKQILNKTKQVLKLIPKGNVSYKKLITSFEKIQSITRKIDLFELEKYLYKTKHKDFKKLDIYFKKVHSIIRKEATKSKYFEEIIQIVAVNNYIDNTGYYFGKKEGIKRYNKVLDHYDPNKTQTKKILKLNWNGFWSLISTKKGIITGCYLGDSFDVEIFYEDMKRCGT